MENRKIYFYINNLSKGGAERVMIQLTNHFAQSGYEVLLITSFEGNDEYAVPSNVKRINLLSGQLMGQGLFRRVTRNFTLISKLRKIIKNDRPDLLVSFMQEPNFRSILATRGTQTRCLVSVRNDPKQEYGGRVGGIVAKYILPRAEGCVFQTKDAQAYFCEKLQKKSAVIFNQVTQNFFETAHHPQKNITAVGRLAPQKNYPLLINAFSAIASVFPEYTLNIYGNGPEETALRELIHEKNMDRRIVLKGTTDNVPAVLAESEVFVLASDFEGMPNALMEALAVGVPSIATDCPCGGPKMLIQSEVNGILVPVGDKPALEKALTRVLKEDELRRNISLNAKKKAKVYMPDNIFKEWNNFFETVLNDDFK